VIERFDIKLMLEPMPLFPSLYTSGWSGVVDTPNEVVDHSPNGFYGLLDVNTNSKPHSADNTFTTALLASTRLGERYFFSALKADELVRQLGRELVLHCFLIGEKACLQGDHDSDGMSNCGPSPYGEVTFGR
jgi:hypothetical protein